MDKSSTLELLEFILDELEPQTRSSSPLVECIGKMCNCSTSGEEEQGFLKGTL